MSALYHGCDLGIRVPVTCVFDMAYPSFVDVLAKLFRENRNDVFALDPRSYPSKFMKRGVDDAALTKMFVILDVVLRAMLEAG